MTDYSIFGPPVGAWIPAGMPGSPHPTPEPEPVVDPGYDPSPLDGVSYFRNRKNLTVDNMLDRKNLSKRGLFYREPVTTKWYESKWLWFWVGVTVVFAIVMEYQFLQNPTAGYSMTHPFSQEDRISWYEAMLTWFVWVYWAWMPLGIGAIGGLQKAGYKRLAVAWAIGLTALMTLFFNHSKETSPNR
jgi:hypothetical protein